ncbi:ferritin-like domain-containing protein [Nostoc sp. CHAB 5836]|uniref:ferritin-like domain-containing protein n=1 Tax=Nostoc sp. CHAB 5836 TaxID=2780404 RepID=UPI001E3FEAF4|nr:ferritin-like domain-containing protein [Nostoc sp. CHAB 5836]MCC5618825.1 ferritin-like domain-containing protein [Nostoc sp. CHAB 5836]
MLIKILIYIGLRNEQQFIRLLAKLEYGVAIFCFKLAAIALEEHRYNLAKLLQEHARDEQRHGKMLSSLSGDKIKLSETGQWIELYQNQELKVIKNTDEETKVLQGVYYSGQFENLDGISKRYLSLRILFQGKSAIDYPWEDRFAFMQILEEGTGKLYKALSKVASTESLRAIASQIAQDEVNHQDYLWHASYDWYPDLIKWESRVGWAMWGLAVDLFKLWK